MVVLGDETLVDQAFDQEDVCGRVEDGFREKLSKQDNVGKIGFRRNKLTSHKKKKKKKKITSVV